MDIVDDIKEQIYSGTLKPEDKITSEHELCNQYGLSRQTVRHAISVLENEGLVKKVKGSGTYVAKNAITDKKNRNTIVVITNEGIEEMGSHEELIAQNGIYANLYQYQFKQ